MTALAWLCAVVVMFGPGLLTGWLLLARRRRHHALRDLVAAYSHIPRRRR